MHVYKRTGKSDNTIFDDKEKMKIEKHHQEEDEGILDDFSDNSDEEKISEATNSVIELIRKYKFLLRAVIMNILYFQSLERCNDTYKHCYAKFHSHFIYWGVYLLISALIFVNIVINSCHGIISALGFGGKSKGN